MSLRVLVLAAAALILRAAPLFALGQTSWDLELDPYYSDVAFTVPFSSGATETSVEKGEMTTYQDMMVRAFLPRFLILEASVNPLPLGGVLARKASDGFYHQMRASSNLNLLEAVTAGFQEPYALSLFLGKVVDFAPGESGLRPKKRGYVGYLLSVGNYHIMDSLLIPDYWIEAEWKVKGSLENSRRKLSWSFRGGHKSHGNREIADTYYVGIHRDRIDYETTPLSFLLSSAFDYRVDFESKNFRAISHYVLVEKNFPMPKRGWTFSVGVGYLWQGQDKYAGTLAARRRPSDSQILFRPNIKF